MEQLNKQAPSEDVIKPMPHRPKEFILVGKANVELHGKLKHLLGAFQMCQNTVRIRKAKTTCNKTHAPSGHIC